jgi:hypothetical protein
MAIQTLVVSALDNYFNWGTDRCRQLVGVTYLVDHHPLRHFDWSLVAVLFGDSTPHVTTDGSRASESEWFQNQLICQLFKLSTLVLR